MLEFPGGVLGGKGGGGEVKTFKEMYEASLEFLDRWGACPSVKRAFSKTIQ